jgi:regulator of nucleoside diphosphate kinase
MTTRPRILITDDDMVRLRALVRQGQMAARRDQDHLAVLDEELERAHVVAASDIAPDVVTMGSTVRVRDLDRDTSVVYTVVFPAEAAIDRNRISVLAPIGTALLGYGAGDVVEWTTPGGTKRLLIEEVIFQPEAAAGRTAEAVR